MIDEVRWWLRSRLRWAYVKWLLWEPGQGWLRWKHDEAWTCPSSYYEPPEPYVVFPPMRRLWEAIRYQALWPFNFRDEDRRNHRAWI